MPPYDTQTELKRLMEQNAELLKENNVLLKKIHRNAVWVFWLRIAWYILLIGMPFALYFYILEPYFNALGASFEVFSAGMQEIPGWKQLNNAIEQFTPQSIE